MLLSFLLQAQQISGPTLFCPESPGDMGLSLMGATSLKLHYTPGPR